MGDKVAFGILVERYSSSLRRFLCNLTHDDELAKDITQEAFIKAWLSISTFKAASSFQTWLYRIAYNIYYDHLKRQKTYVNNECLNTIGDESQDSTRIEASMDFQTALKRLSDNERTVMLLHYLDDFPLAKIQKITGMGTSTIKSHLHRGRKKMAQFLEHDKTPNNDTK